MYTVTQLVALLRVHLEADPRFLDVEVRGEVADLSRSAPGHLYFNLRDRDSRLRAVMFRRAAAALDFRPAEGLEVAARGAITVYPRGGDLQLQVESLRPHGPGERRALLLETMARLEREGLFARKRAIPRFPRAVGLVTSREGAVLHDMVQVLFRRNPGLRILVSPSPVQGPEAPRRLQEALEALRGTEAEVILLGRGGGSEADLEAFNDEALARAIFASPIPVISAVGHETDTTLADRVADLRAPTPSAAAEMATRDREELRAHLDALRGSLRQAVAGRLQGARGEADGLLGELRSTLVHRLELLRARAARAAGMLDAVSPLRVLARGYALLHLEPGGEPVGSASQAPVGSRLRVRLRDGSLVSRVEEVLR